MTQGFYVENLWINKKAWAHKWSKKFIMKKITEHIVLLAQVYQSSSELVN